MGKSLRGNFFFFFFFTFKWFLSILYIWSLFPILRFPCLLQIWWKAPRTVPVLAPSTAQKTHMQQLRTLHFLQPKTRTVVMWKWSHQPGGIQHMQRSILRQTPAPLVAQMSMKLVRSPRWWQKMDGVCLLKCLLTANWLVFDSRPYKHCPAPGGHQWSSHVWTWSIRSS